jgi:hypothetical protein
MALYSCKTCGKDFRSYNPSPAFCSLVCRAVNQSPIQDPEDVCRRYVSGESQEEIASSLGVAHKAVQTVLRRHGIKPRRAIKRNQIGENNASWKGGVTRSGAGYLLRKMPAHPRANAKGYVPEHVLVAESIYGPIPPEMHVHHLNEVKDDNRPENLVVLAARTHRVLHNLIRYRQVEE